MVINFTLHFRSQALNYFRVRYEHFKLVLFISTPCTTDVQDFLLAYANTFILSTGALLSLFLIGFSASLETTSEAVSVINLLANNNNLVFDARILCSQVKSKAFSRKRSNHTVNEHNQECIFVNNTVVMTTKPPK